MILIDLSAHCIVKNTNYASLSCAYFSSLTRLPLQLTTTTFNHFRYLLRKQRERTTIQASHNTLTLHDLFAIENLRAKSKTPGYLAVNKCKADKINSIAIIMWFICIIHTYVVYYIYTCIIWFIIRLSFIDHGVSPFMSSTSIPVFFYSSCS